MNCFNGKKRVRVLHVQNMSIEIVFTEIFADFLAIRVDTFHLDLVFPESCYLRPISSR